MNWRRWRRIRGVFFAQMVLTPSDAAESRSGIAISLSGVVLSS